MNVQALCPPCHAEKSKSERLTTFANAWYSELSQDTMEAFVDAPKPQQLVFGDGTKNCFELDIVRCRRYAIEKADHLPVACILDRIKPYTEGCSPDFVYIDAGPGDTSNYGNFVAYQGPRWHTWELAMWIERFVHSDTGPITRDHFIAEFTASTHVEAPAIRAVYSDMEGVLLDSLEGEAVLAQEAMDRVKISEGDARTAFVKKIILV